ncbi:hypothetical protein OAK73_01160 [bacterium]|jgi:hypothetical protein|nr:hypothetical protein [bacterium]
MPRHPLATIVVEVKKAGIKRLSKLLLYPIFQLFEKRRPGKGAFSGSGVSVVEAIVTDPDNFPCGCDGLPKHFDEIASPWQARHEFIEELIRLFHRKNGAVIDSLAIRRKKVMRFKQGSFHEAIHLSTFY